MSSPAEHGVGCPQVTLLVCDRDGMKFRLAKHYATLSLKRMLRRPDALSSGPSSPVSHLSSSVAKSIYGLWFQTSGIKMPPSTYSLWDRAKCM